MVLLNELNTNAKYYAKLDIPFLLYGPYRPSGVYNIRIQVLKLKPSKYEYISDYVTIKVLESSKDILSECGRNPVTIPIDWIVEVESLSNILDTKTIDDMIYTIEQYV